MKRKAAGGGAVAGYGGGGFFAGGFLSERTQVSGQAIFIQTEK